MYSYHDCYKILSIESSCDWPGVRKAYKQKIQKWHPDRMTDAAMKSSAEDKLKELNLAYEQLSIYYKLHGYLPAQTRPSDIDADNIAIKPARPRRQPAKQKQPAKQPAKPSEAVKSSNGSSSLNVSKQSSVLSLVVFTVLGLAVYSLLGFESPDGDSKQDDDSVQQESDRLQGTFKAGRKDEPTVLARLNNTSIDDKSSHTEDDHSDKKTEYFTIGSSAVDVLRVQGTPDSVIDNIWFYGESTVEFEDGVVKDWKRSAASPLKAHMDL